VKTYNQIKKNLKFKVSIVSIGLILTLSGCSTRIGDFTILSTKNVDISRLGEYDVVPSRAKGEDLKAFSVPSMEEAVDKAIESVDGGVGMTDVTVELVQGFFQAGYRIEGNVIVDPSRKKAK
jgi:hypothetical protein